MAYEIIWTDEASTDLFNITDYLLETWSQQSADKFITQTLEKIERLAAMPSIGRPTSNQDYFMYKLDKKNVLFFTIENTRLILLSIYPYKKDITKSKYY